jgi:hypothetical protein
VPAPLGATEWAILAAWGLLGLVFFVRVPHVGPGPGSLARMEEQARIPR